MLIKVFLVNLLQKVKSLKLNFTSKSYNLTWNKNQKISKLKMINWWDRVPLIVKRKWSTWPRWTIKLLKLLLKLTRWFLLSHILFKMRMEHSRMRIFNRFNQTSNQLLPTTRKTSPKLLRIRKIRQKMMKRERTLGIMSQSSIKREPLRRNLKWIHSWKPCENMYSSDEFKITNI